MPCFPTTSRSSPVRPPGSDARSRPGTPARARTWVLLDMNGKAAAEAAHEIRGAGGKARASCSM